MKQNSMLWIIIVLLLLIAGVLAVWLLYVLVISLPAAATSPPASLPNDTVQQLTPTPFQVDPADVLGMPDGQDTFDNASNWTLFDNQCYKSEIHDGHYWMTAKGLQGFSCWEVSWIQIDDYYYETVVVMPQDCNPADQFGLFFRAPDNNRGYLYGLTCDGRYSMTSWDGSNTDIIIDLTSNETIKVGPGEQNRIGVIANTNNYSLYVNGHFLSQTSDNLFLEKGKIGYFVRAATEESFTVNYDNLRMWLLGEE